MTPPAFNSHQMNTLVLTTLQSILYRASYGKSGPNYHRMNTLRILAGLGGYQRLEIIIAAFDGLIHDEPFNIGLS